MKWLVIFITFFLSFSAYAQDNLSNLNDHLRKSQEAIAKLDAQLVSNQKLQKDKLTERKLLDAKVSERAKIVHRLDQNITDLKADMGGLTSVVVKHNKRFDSLGEVRDLLYVNAYKALISSKLARVELLDQQHFLKVEIAKVTFALKREAENVDSMRKVMGVRYDDLMRQSQELSRLYSAKNSELSLLNQEKKQLEVLNLQLRKQEIVLKQSADNERVNLQKLQSQIATMVLAESKKSSAAVVGTTFSSNKGSLPAPLLLYSVEDTFGVHNHPTKKGIKIQNTGVNLRATMDLSVRAVFEGEVRGIFLVEGMGTSILIRHGNFFTVYSNLDRVKVAKGQTVSTGQVIGQLNERAKVLHFEVWNGTTNLNPQLWIRKQ